MDELLLAHDGIVLALVHTITAADAQIGQDVEGDELLAHAGLAALLGNVGGEVIGVLVQHGKSRLTQLDTVIAQGLLHHHLAQLLQLLHVGGAGALHADVSHGQLQLGSALVTKDTLATVGALVGLGIVHQLIDGALLISEVQQLLIHQLPPPYSLHSFTGVNCRRRSHCRQRSASHLA